MNTATVPRPSPPAPELRRPRRLGAVAAAVAIIIAMGIVVALEGDGDGDDVVAGPPVELSLGAGDAMASCLPLDAAILSEMSPAFAATATAVDGENVTLTVDRWYAGGDADTVVLRATTGLEALIAGFDFEVGQQYLITAAEGTVNFCGYSGPATPELSALFDQAFAA